MNRRKVLFLNNDLKAGQPVHSRVTAFRDYFETARFNPKGNSEVAHAFIFYSMPPFRNLYMFVKYKGRIILDVRDGWSIAQATGYGGNVRNKPIKSWVTRKIEGFMIRRSLMTITCTPGLREHLEKVSGKKIMLIPNGITDERLELIRHLKARLTKTDVNKQELVFSCAGKFSEYGSDKVRKLLFTINNRYPNKKLIVRLIGSSQDKNNWTVGFFSNLTAGRGKVQFFPRMNEQELYSEMLNADYGLTIIRDPDYDFGTKVYDYIAIGLPVVNYFDSPNNFTDYFDACLDVSFGRNNVIPEIRRSVLIKNELDNVRF